MEREHQPIFSTLPPGFRFHPSDEELIVHYLRNKVVSHPLPAELITEIDLYKYNPWDLPKKALFGEDEWYFFTPREKKYPNGKRPNRAAASGYWKAASSDKPILTASGSKRIGVKKALVFYTGRAPNGVKTDWLMDEYRLLDSTVKASKLKGSMRISPLIRTMRSKAIKNGSCCTQLDDWVLCRVQQRGNTTKTTCNSPDSYSNDLWRCLPKVEQTQPSYANSHADIITDFLYKDCPLLASILAGQIPPPIETNSNVSFHRSNDHYEARSNNKVKSTISISPMGINSNPLKRKAREENTKENLFPLSNNRGSKNKDEDFLPKKRLAGNAINCYIPDPSQHDILEANATDTTIFEEFNDLTFLGTYFE